MPQDEVDRLLPKEIKTHLESLVNIKSDKERLEIFMEKVVPLISENCEWAYNKKSPIVTIRGKVRDEHGKPVSGADVTLLQLKSFQTSQELPSSCEPVKVTVKTDLHGNYAFKQIPRLNAIYIASFIKKNSWPAPNLKISVKSDEHETQEKKIVTINRFDIAISIKLLQISEQFLRKNGRENEINPINSKFHIPMENRLDDIVLDFLLKKE